MIEPVDVTKRNVESAKIICDKRGLVGLAQRPVSAGYKKLNKTQTAVCKLVSDGLLIRQMSHPLINGEAIKKMTKNELSALLALLDGGYLRLLCVLEPHPDQPFGTHHYRIEK